MEEEVLKSILAHNPQDLKREGRDFEFTGIGEQIETIYNFVRDLNENKDYFNKLPETEQENLRQRLAKINELFNRIKDFQPADIPNAQEVRDSITAEIKEVYAPIYEFNKGLDIYRLKTTGAQAELANIRKEAKRTFEETKKIKEDISEVSKTARKSASKIPLYEYLGIFSATSDYHKKIAYMFFWSAIVLAVVTIFILYWISSDFAKTISNSDSVHKIYAYMILKLFFIAIVIYILQQAIRNYLANMHQSVLNKHRENSLKVFDAMLKTSDDPSTHDQILTQLSKAIFDSGETGFCPGKDISKDGPDIVQIFKDATKLK